MATHEERIKVFRKIVFAVYCPPAGSANFTAFRHAFS